MNWILWLAGATAMLLFGYLVYALLRAEDIE
ncbi:K(+)-transporting ATPase subunit F [Paraburkholderia hayleyella]|nr:K(+)-transporting ATPase subunit F [Paraburkholderia hayleyella]